MYARFDMVGSSTPLPASHADLIARFRKATVTRAVVERKARYPLNAVYDADGALVRNLGHALFGHFLSETVPALCRTRHADEDVALIFHPLDEAGRNGAKRMDVSGLEHAFAGLGRTKSGFLGRMLGWLDR